MAEVIFGEAFGLRIGGAEDLPEILGPLALLLFWGVAILCAAASVALYRRWLKPWYVRLNLTINISGLVFTGLVLLLILWHFAFR